MAKVYDNATDLITFARGSSATYLDSDGVIKTAATDAPRIEYAEDGTLKGLLIEEQRTNLLTYSEDFSNAAWGKSANGTGSVPVVSASGVTDPAGGAGAYQVELDAGSGTTTSDQSKLSTSVTSTQGADYTHSIWVRGDAGGEQINIRGAGQGAYQLVTLTTDWQRVTGTEAAFSTLSPIEIAIRQSVNGVINSTATIHVYGAQLEEGSFATSYIPTSGSQQTRSADVASIPVSAFGYNQSAGTVVVEFSKMYPDAAYNRFHAGFGANSGNYVGLGYGSIQAAYIQPLVGTIVVSGASAPSPGEFATVAASFDASGATSAVDGQSNSATATGAAPAFSPSDKLYLGSSAFNPTVIGPGHIKSIQYYPRRLTDAQLQELTA